MKTIRVLLLEDNRILRIGITAMVNGEPDMKIVASSGSHEDLLTQARKLKPDVVLLDLGLRNVNGLHFLKSLIRDRPGIRVIGMGLIPTQLDIVESMEGGGVGIYPQGCHCGGFSCNRPVGGPWE